jgi:hypothetical protein
MLACGLSLRVSTLARPAARRIAGSLGLLVPHGNACATIFGPPETSLQRLRDGSASAEFSFSVPKATDEESKAPLARPAAERSMVDGNYLGTNHQGAASDS